VSLTLELITEAIGVSGRFWVAGPKRVDSGHGDFLNRCSWDLQLSVLDAELPGEDTPLVNLTHPRYFMRRHSMTINQGARRYRACRSASPESGIGWRKLIGAEEAPILFGIQHLAKPVERLALLSAVRKNSGEAQDRPPSSWVRDAMRLGNIPPLARADRRHIACARV